MRAESTDGYRVTIGAFEGPLDLLLSLIEKRKMHISDVSLGQVTDDYLAYIRDLERFSVPEMADFIVTASTLMLIKARALLPKFELSEDESGSMEELGARLNLLQIFRRAADTYLAPIFGTCRIFEREAVRPEPVFAPSGHAELNTHALAAAMAQVLADVPKPEPLPQATVKKIVSIEEVMQKLFARIQKNLKVSFAEYAKRHEQGTREGRLGIVMIFLAMLELARRGAILAVQHRAGGDITIESQELGTPHYGA